VGCNAKAVKTALLVQPGGKKNPFCPRPYWAILTPDA
jgi:hypothetical protein